MIQFTVCWCFHFPLACSTIERENWIKELLITVEKQEWRTMGKNGVEKCSYGPRMTEPLKNDKSMASSDFIVIANESSSEAMTWIKSCLNGKNPLSSSISMIRLSSTNFRAIEFNLEFCFFVWKTVPHAFLVGYPIFVPALIYTQTSQEQPSGKNIVKIKTL